MVQDPFGDLPPERERVNPFGEEVDEAARESGDPVATVRHSAARIRRLKSLVGAEGLTLSGTRELLDEIARALDAIARDMEG